MLVISPGEPHEDDLAILLLDMGAADLVIVGTTLPQYANLIDTKSQLRILPFKDAAALRRADYLLELWPR